MYKKSSVETESGIRVAARSGSSGLTRGRDPGYPQADVYLAQDPSARGFQAFHKENVDRVISTTAGAPLCHETPLHVGDAAELVVEALDQDGWRDNVLPDADEAVVFWPCGLTALHAPKNPSTPFLISHAPGAMCVTDLTEVSA